MVLSESSASAFDIVKHMASKSVNPKRCVRALQAATIYSLYLEIQIRKWVLFVCFPNDYQTLILVFVCIKLYMSRLLSSSPW